jgi:hypothetical protein
MKNHILFKFLYATKLYLLRDSWPQEHLSYYGTKRYDAEIEEIMQLLNCIDYKSINIKYYKRIEQRIVSYFW